MYFRSEGKNNVSRIMRSNIFILKFSQLPVNDRTFSQFQLIKADLHDRSFSRVIYTIVFFFSINNRLDYVTFQER